MVHGAWLRRVWPWLPLWAALALLAIFAHGPMPLHSTRTLSVAWEMWNGGHWLLPHLNGVPYSDKVPLLYWVIHAGWAVFGVSDVWPRLLQVLLGIAQLILARQLIERLFPQQRTLVDAASWMLIAFSYAFLFDLQIMYEVLLAVCVLAAMLCLVGDAKRGAPRFGWLALCLGLGLLSKGPVMLLHVLPLWLLGPWWSHWARAHQARWYGFGALAVLGGAVLFALWLVPAAVLGGTAYRHALLVTQTAGRVVEAFDHARPWWWYAPIVVLLLLPFAAWPRLWAAILVWRGPLQTGMRFALCWLLPVLLAFSLISGKQAYYLIPEMAAFAMLMAAALEQLPQRRAQLAQHRALGPWPLALGGFGLAACLAMLPWWASHNATTNVWLTDLVPYAPWFAPVFALLGLLLLLRAKRELQRIAIAGMLGVFALHALFTMALWRRNDLRPTAAALATAQANGDSIAIIGLYAGQYHFLARLDDPIERIQWNELPAWANEHPRGVVITDPDQLPPTARGNALSVQAFRSRWVLTWRATTLAALRATTPDR